jgi:hypothetical protein
MAGLYDGVEEAAFMKVAGGFIFQTNNPWFFGPRRRYFVSEAQKVDIAKRIRETLQRLVPFVIAAAIIFPIVIIGGTFWFALRGGTLTVTETNAAGKTKSYAQPIGANGSDFVLAGEGGAMLVCHVSGLPGNGATITYTWIDAKGKAGARSSLRFAPTGATFNIVDSSHRRINSAVAVGRVGATPNSILLCAMLLTLLTLGPYFAGIHIFSKERLRPLIANLPRSLERISRRDRSRNLASKLSYKLLAIMGFGSAASFFVNGASIVGAAFEHRPSVYPAFVWTAFVLSALLIARILYFVLLKTRLRGRVA